MKYEVYDRCGKLIGVNSVPCCYHNGMGGNANWNDWTKRVLLLFDVEELKYDISNVAFVQGESVVTDANGTPEDRKNNAKPLNQWYGVCEDGNFDRVKRQMSVAVSECEHKLYNLTKMPLYGHTSLDNQRRRNNEYLVELRVKDDFSETTAVALLNFVHDYIVARVLEDWAGVCVRPDFMEYWRSRRNELLEMIGKEGNKSNNSGDARIAASWC